MTYALTVARDERGNDEVHRGGCSHLTHRRLRSGGGSWGTYRGATLLDAIVAADTDMADAFGEQPYSDPDTQDSQPWSVQIMKHAPCFADDLRSAGIAFSGPWGRPEVTR